MAPFCPGWRATALVAGLLLWFTTTTTTTTTTKTVSSISSHPTTNGHQESWVTATTQTTKRRQKRRRRRRRRRRRKRRRRRTEEEDDDDEEEKKTRSLFWFPAENNKKMPKENGWTQHKKWTKRTTSFNQARPDYIDDYFYYPQEEEDDDDVDSGKQKNSTHTRGNSTRSSEQRHRYHCRGRNGIIPPLAIGSCLAFCLATLLTVWELYRSIVISPRQDSSPSLQSASVVTTTKGAHDDPDHSSRHAHRGAGFLSAHDSNTSSPEEESLLSARGAAHNSRTGVVGGTLRMGGASSMSERLHRGTNVGLTSSGAGKALSSSRRSTPPPLPITAVEPGESQPLLPFHATTAMNYHAAPHHHIAYHGTAMAPAPSSSSGMGPTRPSTTTPPPSASPPAAAGPPSSSSSSRGHSTTRSSLIRGAPGRSGQTSSAHRSKSMAVPFSSSSSSLSPPSATVGVTNSGGAVATPRLSPMAVMAPASGGSGSGAPQQQKPARVLSSGERMRRKFYQLLGLAILSRAVLIPVEGYYYFYFFYDINDRFPPAPSNMSLLSWLSVSSPSQPTDADDCNKETNDFHGRFLMTSQAQEREYESAFLDTEWVAAVIKDAEYTTLATSGTNSGSSSSSTLRNTNGNNDDNGSPIFKQQGWRRRPVVTTRSPPCIFARTFPDFAFASAYCLLVLFIMQMATTASGSTGGGTAFARIVKGPSFTIFNVCMYSIYGFLLFITGVLPVLPYWAFQASLWTVLFTIYLGLLILVLYHGPVLLWSLRPVLTRQRALAWRLLTVVGMCTVIFVFRSVYFFLAAWTTNGWHSDGPLPSFLFPHRDANDDDAYWYDYDDNAAAGTNTTSSSPPHCCDHNCRESGYFYAWHIVRYTCFELTPSLAILVMMHQRSRKAPHLSHENLTAVDEDAAATATMPPPPPLTSAMLKTTTTTTTTTSRRSVMGSLKGGGGDLASADEVGGVEASVSLSQLPPYGTRSASGTHASSMTTDAGMAALRRSQSAGASNIVLAAAATTTTSHAVVVPSKQQRYRSGNAASASLSSSTRRSIMGESAAVGAATNDNL